MVVQVCVLGVKGGGRQEDLEFKASLSYLDPAKGNKAWACTRLGSVLSTGREKRGTRHKEFKIFKSHM